MPEALVLQAALLEVPSLVLVVVEATARLLVALVARAVEVLARMVLHPVPLAALTLAVAAVEVTSSLELAVTVVPAS